MNLLFYSFDPVTKELVGSFSLDTTKVKQYSGKYQLSDTGGINLTEVPVEEIDFSMYGGDYSTLEAPPEVTGPNQKPVFIDGKWKLVPDHRFITYYDKQTGAPVHHPLGLGPDVTKVTDKPWPGSDFSWQNGDWVESEESKFQKASLAAVELQKAKMADVTAKINELEDNGDDASSLRAARVKIRNIQTSEGYPFNITWPEF